MESGGWAKVDARARPAGVTARKARSLCAYVVLKIASGLSCDDLLLRLLNQGGSMRTLLSLAVILVWAAQPAAAQVRWVHGPDKMCAVDTKRQVNSEAQVLHTSYY